MKKVIYGDVYFTVNFCMDFTALFITAKIMKKPVRSARFCVASAIGAVYAVLSLFIENKVLSTVLSIVTPFVMCAIAYSQKRSFSIKRKHTSKREYLFSVAIFFAVSFLLGGIISSVYLAINKYLTGRGIYINGRIDTIYSELPLWLLGALAACSAVLSTVIGKAASRRIASKRCDVCITDGIKKVEFCALCDSGNLLHDPISDLPVVIVSPSIAKGILPMSLFRTVMKSDICSIDHKYMKKVRIIPTKTLTGESMLIGYIPDLVTVSSKEKRVVIAVDTSLKETDVGSFDGCDGIVPVEIV